MYQKYTEENFLELIILGTLVLLFLVGLMITFFVIYNNRKNKVLKEKLQLQSKFEQELLQTQIEIQEQTLANISQELHDNIGQSLTLAKLNLNTLPVITDDKANSQINNTKTLIGNTLTNIRDLAKSMLGEKIVEIGMEAALHNELKLLEQTGKYTISFASNGEPYLLNPQKEIVGFRIMQEALHNIIKHANATAIHIAIDYVIHSIQINITDNGKGFDANALLASETGIGLKNMHNRAILINGKLNIISTPFQGTSLTLSIQRI